MPSGTVNVTVICTEIFGQQSIRINMIEEVNLEKFSLSMKKSCLWNLCISAWLDCLSEALIWKAEISLTLSKYGQTPVKIMLKPRDIRNIVKYIIRIEIHLSLFSCCVSKPSDSSGTLCLKTTNTAQYI